MKVVFTSYVSTVCFCQPMLCCARAMPCQTPRMWPWSHHMTMSAREWTSLPHLGGIFYIKKVLNTYGPLLQKKGGGGRGD